VSGKYWRAGDKVQTVTINGTPTGGTFRLFSGGNQADLAYNAAAATVQTAVRAWGGIYSGVTVTGSAGGPYTITFADVASNVTNAGGPVRCRPVPADRWHSRHVEGHHRGDRRRAAPTRCSAVSAATGRRPPTASAWTSPCAISKEASYYDGTTWHSAFQENLVLLLVEAYYGFVMGSKDAFCTYTKGTAAF
jgi:hypothetical protein